MEATVKMDKFWIF